MSKGYKVITDLKEYVNLRAKGDTKITLEIKEKLARMDEFELELTDAYYRKLLKANIRMLGEIGCIELAIELARWLYPRILREAYKERSKDYMLPV